MQPALRLAAASAFEKVRKSTSRGWCASSGAKSWPQKSR